MHLDMMNEFEKKIYGDLKLHQIIFEIWSNDFNTERPHDSLKMNTPSQVYRKSKRKLKDVAEIKYPKNYITRFINSKGYTTFMGRRIFISNAFNGFTIGFDETVKNHTKVWFYIIFRVKLTGKLFSLHQMKALLQ